MGENGQLEVWLHIASTIIARLPTTIGIVASSTLFGLALGFAIALIRIRKSPIPYAIATFYLSFMRCTPTLVQLFLVYYGLPQLLNLFGLDVNNWHRLVFVIITYSLHCAAFFSEVIRSSYLSVDRGQQEAAYSIGMNGWQTIRRIIWPQAFSFALPNLSNNVIMLLKETSLAFSIGVTDIMGQAQIINGNNYGATIMQVYIVVSLIYWSLSIVIERSGALLERNYKKGHVGLAREAEAQHSLSRKEVVL